MANITVSNPSTLVDWRFTLVEQNSVTRYGVMLESFYKQYLPGGVEVPQLHPIKRIDKKLYELAHRQYSARLPKP